MSSWACSALPLTLDSGSPGLHRFSDALGPSDTDPVTSQGRGTLTFMLCFICI